MSNETPAQKKSILTSAMEAVAAKKNAASSDEVLTPEQLEVKQTLRKARIFAGSMVAVAIATTAVLVKLSIDEKKDEKTED